MLTVTVVDHQRYHLWTIFPPNERDTTPFFEKDLCFFIVPNAKSRSHTMLVTFHFFFNVYPPIKGFFTDLNVSWLA